MILSRFYRLDNLIMEAISNLKEPGGSNKTTIATYIEVLLPSIGCKNLTFWFYPFGLHTNN